MIYTLVFSLIVALHPGVSIDMAHDVAVAIDDVALSTDEAISLLTIAAHESSLRPSVANCERTGDHGRSIGLWQIQRHWWRGHSRDEICSDPTLAAHLAAKAWRRTGSFRAYAGCQFDLPCKAADEMSAMRAKYLRRVGQ